MTSETVNPQIQQPNAFQRLLLQAPLNEHLFAGTAKATGKSAGIKFLCARDAQVLKEDYACLIIRSSYQALLEVQADLFKYLSLIFPGTKYNSQDSIFKLGGKTAPFGTIELAYSAASPLEQARALTRLQGRSKSTIIVDEAGATASILDFTDELLGVLRGKPEVPRRLIMLGNPGGPAHSELKARFVDPLPFPLESMKPQRFWSEHYQRFCISLSATPAINPHIDLNQYRREIELMSHGDPDVLDALLLGRWGELAGGSAFGQMWSPRRSHHELPEGYCLRDHLPRPFVSMDWGISAPTAAYLIVPDPPGIDAPLGTLLLVDEMYICQQNRAGRDFTKGAMLSNAEQAALLAEWLERWGLTPGQLRILCDDAVFSRNGSPTGSVAGDFRQAGVRLTPADKANTKMGEGLGKLKSRMANTRVNYKAPWLLWSRRCTAWSATIPSLAKDSRNPELLAPGQAEHACDAVRYGLCWYDSKFRTGVTNHRIW